MVDLSCAVPEERLAAHRELMRRIIEDLFATGNAALIPSCSPLTSSTTIRSPASGPGTTVCATGRVAHRAAAPDARAAGGRGGAGRGLAIGRDLRGGASPAVSPPGAVTAVPA